MKKNIFSNFLIVLITLFLLEGAVRLLVKPSEHCFGEFFHLELPPCDMKYFDLSEDSKNMNIEKMKVAVNENKSKNPSLTVDDLFSAYEDDAIIGYINRRNYISTNKWWQTNNLGARRREDTAADIPSRYQRILVFGDSFTNGRGLPQEKTWPYYLEQSLEKTQVLNFGANGYSTTQSYLRFQSIASQIDYDTVMFMFLAMDLAREINVAACFRKWISCRPKPRFLLEDDDLKLIKSPYPDRESYYAQNAGEFSDEFLDHLRTYDRYYFPQKFEDQPLLGKSVLYKIGSAAFVQRKVSRLNRNLINPDSEAFQITKTIFQKIQEETKQNEKDFVLVFLPAMSNIKKYQSKDSYREKWDIMVREMCSSGISCFDLMDEFQKLPMDMFDTSYAGTHYGPRINLFISDQIKNFLQRINQ